MKAAPKAKTDLKPGDKTVLGPVVSTKLSPSKKTIVVTVARPDGTEFTDRMSAAGNMYVFTDEPETHLSETDPAFELLCGTVAVLHPDMPMHAVEAAAREHARDRGVAYVALCVSCGSEPQEALAAKVRAREQQ